MVRSIVSVALGTISWGILWAATWQALLAALPDAFHADGGTESAAAIAGGPMAAIRWASAPKTNHVSLSHNLDGLAFA